jgi:DNA-binding NtrC family response regulator
MSGEPSDPISTAVRPRPDDEPCDAPTFIVTVMEGPDKGAVLTVDSARPGRAFVGTSPTSDLCLTDREVSRRHLAFVVEGSRLRVSDLGSSNGTRVGSLVLLDGFVDHGDTLQAGRSVLRIERRKELGPRAPTDALRFGRTLGASVVMRRLYPLFERLAASDVSVVIEGETGTGKELLAESLHEEGPRSRGPFVVFDCSAVVLREVEEELFGTESGAGAASVRAGVFERAHGGTLLLDEVAELPMDAQPKLLRVLERREVRRVGGQGVVPVDARVVAATRKNLEREVQAGRFREDLYYRLAVARVELPPLRQRDGDVGLLARHMWRELNTDSARIACSLPAWFEAYEWPGNVRELRNSVARILALGEWSDPSPEALASGESESRKVGTAEATVSGAGWADEILALDLPMQRARQRLSEEFERRYVERLLARYGGDVSRAAAASGVARRYFQLLRARHRKDG